MHYSYFSASFGRVMKTAFAAFGEVVTFRGNAIEVSNPIAFAFVELFLRVANFENFNCKIFPAVFPNSAVNIKVTILVLLNTFF